jgi:hypothetical protein
MWPRVHALSFALDAQRIERAGDAVSETTYESAALAELRELLDFCPNSVNQITPTIDTRVMISAYSTTP